MKKGLGDEAPWDAGCGWHCKKGANRKQTYDDQNKVEPPDPVTTLIKGDDVETEQSADREKDDPGGRQVPAGGEAQGSYAHGEADGQTGHGEGDGARAWRHSVKG